MKALAWTIAALILLGDLIPVMVWVIAKYEGCLEHKTERVLSRAKPRSTTNMATIEEYLMSEGMGVAAAEVRRLRSIEEFARAVVHATYSHIDGRDLLAELHPRSELDIKRRVDGHDRWYQGDWLTGLYQALKPLRATLFREPIARTAVDQIGCLGVFGAGQQGPMPNSAQGIEARQGEDPSSGLHPKDESPVAEGDAP